MRCFFESDNFDEALKYIDEKKLNISVKVYMKNKKRGVYLIKNLYDRFLRKEAQGVEMVIYRMIENIDTGERWFYVDFNLDSGLMEEISRMADGVQYLHKLGNQHCFYANIKY